MSDSTIQAPVNYIYTSQDRIGVIFLVVAGFASITAVIAGVVYYIFYIKRTKTFHRTHIAPYLASLLLANVLQAIGTIMSARWIQQGIVYDGGFCASQGAIKNGANVGTAIWSFTIAAHVFNLLFLRWKPSRFGTIITLIVGWLAVLLIVASGPLVFETPDNPYFGVSGVWCWITETYPEQRTYLEYFIEFLSAGLGFILYLLVLLRVRGNLVKIEDKWSLKWVPRGEAWQLAFSRDMLDNAMLKVVKFMVWYPVAYSLLVIPIAIARFSSFMGHHVPFWVTVLTDMMFNLTGLVNTILFISTRKILPDTSSLPQFTTPRNETALQSEVKYGVTPFVLDPEQIKVAKMYLSDDDLRSNRYGAGLDVGRDSHNHVQEQRELDDVPDFIVLPSLSFAYSAQSARH